MPFDSANHFDVSGAGIDGAIDLTSLAGDALVSLTVDGRALRDPSLETTREGIVVSAIHEEIPDDHTLLVTVTRLRAPDGGRLRRADHGAHVDR